MALSPMPFNLHSSSSIKFPFQSLFHPGICSSKRLRRRLLKISCCQQTAQLADEIPQKNVLVRKKKKPRPSFLAQIQDKWSLKTPSLRETFPWEGEESNRTNQESEALRVHVSEDVSFRLLEIEKSNSLVGSIGSDVKSKSNLTPWVHGCEPVRKLFESEAGPKFQRSSRKTEKILDGLHQQHQNKQDSIIAIQDSKDLLQEVTVDDQKTEHFDATTVITSEENKILGDEKSEDDTFISVSTTMDRKVVVSEHSGNVNGLMRMPWEKMVDENLGKGENLKKSNTELSERLIPEPELQRLRNVSLRTVERMKVGAAGVTQVLVDAIHEKWKKEEVVKLKFEGLLSKNMKKTHELLERRTGGLIIWRSGSSVVVYRGMTYKLDCVNSFSKHLTQAPESESTRPYVSNCMKNVSNGEPAEFNELNFLLDELGPRFIDWSGREPLPVDADLLPAVIPGYRPPFRHLSHGIRRVLLDKEMTYFRTTARTLPPHFALGRNRELQGLAVAMVKLWKKSAIAKIAIKRSVLNTSNERMAEELKILTGGTLLSRNKEFIVFYRGNDFLPPAVSSALTEAESNMNFQQDEEEQARYRAATLIESSVKVPKQPLVAGTLAETEAAASRWGNKLNSGDIAKMMKDEAVARQRSLISCLQKKLVLAKEKIWKSEKVLYKVHVNFEPADLPTDLETLTDEERFLFRKIGLSMKPYLILGKREIFDGTIENMHLHWKFRELVKIIVDRKKFSRVKHIAVSLEAESGGLLVSVENTTKGYAIILYRGKNYQRPSTFRPRTLLTKRQALHRSIELQRREALKHHVLELEEKIEKLKHGIECMETAAENKT